MIDDDVNRTRPPATQGDDPDATRAPETQGGGAFDGPGRPVTSPTTPVVDPYATKPLGADPSTPRAGRTARRPLQADAQAGEGGARPRLAGARHRPEPRRRAQGDPPRQVRPPRDVAPLPQGGPGHRAARAPQHRPGLRAGPPPRG